MIDLHIHSTASDGSFTPAEIIDQASNAGVCAIAITDHDTVDGVKQAIESGIPQHLEFITGVELSAQALDGFTSGGSIHILGYGFSPYDKDMQIVLKKLKQARAQRNPRIIEKLNELGFSISLKEVKDICGPGQTGRPHIARTMLEKGFISSFEQAFDDYLAKGKPAYVDKFRLSCKQTIQLILDAGGIPVLAHPGLIKPSPGYLIENFISQLIGMGLKGIEVYHTDHSKEQTRHFEKIASKKNLIVTGGSDFHGILKQEISIGKGTGDLCIDYSVYKNLSLELELQKKKTPSIEKLEKNLCYEFNNKDFLINALRHSSYVNEVQNPEVADNQRLEFLGDAVLGLAIGHVLMDRFPQMKEGELSKLRATLVSEPGLAAMARQIDLGRFIFLGKGERLSRGSEKSSILADTFEAVIAAIYLDYGFEGSYKLIKQHFNAQIDHATSSSEVEDYKSMLQEFVQEIGDITPRYKILNETGPDHDKTFEISLCVCEIESTGIGKSKKSAEQHAAEKALKILLIRRTS